YVQLHGHEPRDFAAALDVPAIRVLRVAAADGNAVATSSAQTSGETELSAANRSAAAAAALPAAPANVLAALVDVEDASGGSGGLGRRADSTAVAACVAMLPGGTRVFVSGGLTAENVAGVVRMHRPFAVDVSSGVESAPGAKDPARIAAFVTAAKGA